MTTSIIIIPARMDSSRLPGKPLADIVGKPMICHVCDRAIQAKVGPVCVATDSDEIFGVVKSYGCEAILTSADHQSGSDRIWEALNRFDPQGRFKTIINVQGDLPTIDPELIAKCGTLLEDQETDVATLCTPIVDEQEATNPNVVKVIGANCSPDTLNALYFSRATAPWGEGPLYHHIGLYGYKRQALQQFVSLSPSQLETRERLEQLRALEAGMTIKVGIVNSNPLGVDTPEDLETVRTLLGQTQN